MTARTVPDRQCDADAIAKLRPFSRPDIHQLIAKGHQIIVANHRVLKLDKWLTRHPGGEKTILHMVGRDATDEINGYSILAFGC
jgi:Cytochrome b5-like Heme/Steroid binding domain